MSWVDDESERAVTEDEDRARRERVFEQQASGMWQDLIFQLKQDVERINQNRELIDRRLGGEKLQIRDQGNGLEIIKIVYTAIYLRLEFQGRSIGVERKIVTNGQSRRSKTERENISMEIYEGYQLVLKNERGEPLTIEEASKYLLTPLLNTHTR
jgi:hypothetical protein